MLDLAFLAGAAAYVLVAASIPFVLLWDLLAAIFEWPDDIGVSEKERKRRYRQLIEAAAPPSQAPPPSRGRRG